MDRCCLFAIDGGPRETLSPLARKEGHDWVESEGGVGVCGYLNYFELQSPAALIVGTSRSPHGLKKESEARCAAKSVGLLVVAIEDYPGNYQDIEQGAADLLVVESEMAAAFTRARLERRCPPMVTGATIRYDALKPGKTTNSGCIDTVPHVLWVGQPETGDALHSLGILLPHLNTLGVKLLFRAHPRDLGYASGAYRSLFASYAHAMRDVSDLDLASVIALGPCLGLTHFSSLAVVLGFHGIPSMHVLYPEGGQKRLRSLTGYTVPLVCQAGGSDTIATPDETAEKLRRAIFDGEWRRLVMQRFREYYEAETPRAEWVVTKIQHALGRPPSYHSEII